jgi:hypothetical protein
MVTASFELLRETEDERVFGIRRRDGTIACEIPVPHRMYLPTEPRFAQVLHDMIYEVFRLGYISEEEYREAWAGAKHLLPPHSHDVSGPSPIRRTPPTDSEGD